MTNFFELIDNFALTISGHEENKIWFSSIDLKYIYISDTTVETKRVTNATSISWEETLRVHRALNLLSKLFPFSWPEMFDSKFMAVLTKQIRALKNIVNAIEEDRKKSDNLDCKREIFIKT